MLLARSTTSDHTAVCLFELKVNENMGVYKYFSGAKEVYIDTSPAPKKCVKILLRNGMVYINTSLASPAPEEKY